MKNAAEHLLSQLQVYHISFVTSAAFPCSFKSRTSLSADSLVWIHCSESAGKRLWSSAMLSYQIGRLFDKLTLYLNELTWEQERTALMLTACHASCASPNLSFPNVFIKHQLFKQEPHCYIFLTLGKNERLNRHLADVSSFFVAHY